METARERKTKKSVVMAFDDVVDALERRDARHEMMDCFADDHDLNPHDTLNVSMIIFRLTSEDQKEASTFEVKLSEKEVDAPNGDKLILTPDEYGQVTGYLNGKKVGSDGLGYELELTDEEIEEIPDTREIWSPRTIDDPGEPVGEELTGTSTWEGDAVFNANVFIDWKHFAKKYGLKQFLGEKENKKGGDQQ